MKKFYLLLMFSFFSAAAIAQVEEEPYREPEIKGFDWNDVFLGGGLGLNVGTGRFGFSVTPEVGYSIADWVDVGLVFNFNYSSIKFQSNAGGSWADYKQQNTIFGAGTFLRVYPIPSVFIQLQPEVNWITIKQSMTNTSLTQKFHYNATSVLGGVGYAQRIVGRSNFYIMIGLDLMQEVNSPYRDMYNNAILQYRSGLNFYLGKRK